MQFGCESCKAQLQIADEKVRGRRLIVRCRRCGAKIALADPMLADSSPRLVSPAPMRIVPRPEPAKAVPRDLDDESTRAMDSDVLERALRASKGREVPQNGSPATEKLHFPPPAVPLDGPIWYAMIRGKQTGPVTRDDLRERADQGELGPRTYLWREGMDAWQHAKDVPELGDLFPGLPDRPRFSAAPDPAAKAVMMAPATGQQSQPEPTAIGQSEGASHSAVAQSPSPAESVAHAPTAQPAAIQEQSAPDLKETLPLASRSTPMFESATPSDRAPFLVFLALIALAAAAIVLWILLASKPESAPPAPHAARPPPAEPAAVGLTAEQVHQKLDENKPALQGCVDDALRRDPHLKLEKIHVATTIAPTGEVTAARIDQPTVDESALGVCLKSATKRIVFPQFAGSAFDVDIPIVVKAGE